MLCLSVSVFVFVNLVWVVPFTSKPAKVVKQRAERAKAQGPRVEARCEEIVQKEGEEDQVRHFTVQSLFFYIHSSLYIFTEFFLTFSPYLMVIVCWLRSFCYDFVMDMYFPGR